MLANNHVLDWGYSGLADTLRSLHQAGLRTAGAGRNQQQCVLRDVESDDLGREGTADVRAHDHADGLGQGHPEQDAGEGLGAGETLGEDVGAGEPDRRGGGGGVPKAYPALASSATHIDAIECCDQTTSTALADSSWASISRVYSVPPAMRVSHQTSSPLDSSAWTSGAMRSRSCRE